MLEDGTIRVAVTATPSDGLANAAVEQVIAKKLGIAKSLVSVVSGFKSREKVVETPLTADQFFAKIKEAGE